MKTVFYLIPVIVILVTYLIYLELFEKRKQIFFVKPLSTILVIITAILSSSEFQLYSAGVIAGLVFCLGGDVALMFQDDKKLFRIGLVLFLLGHIAYAAVFTIIGTFSVITAAAALTTIVLGVVIYVFIRDNLDTMRIPVIAYIVIISVMTIQASGTFANPAIQKSHAFLIFGGAVLFYISDVILAANRFWKPWRYNRISLGFYYSGQLLIALSAGL